MERFLALVLAIPMVFNATKNEEIQVVAEVTYNPSAPSIVLCSTESPLEEWPAQEVTVEKIEITEDIIISFERPVVETTEPTEVVIETEEAFVEETEPVIEIEETFIEETEMVFETEETFIEETEPVIETEEVFIEENEPVIETEEAFVEETEAVTELEEITIEETEPTEDPLWEELVGKHSAEEIAKHTGQLTAAKGYILDSPCGLNGKYGTETWYPDAPVKAVEMMEELYGFENLKMTVDEETGIRMLSGTRPNGVEFKDLIVVAADVRDVNDKFVNNLGGIFERGDIVETSLGTAIVVDYCERAVNVRKANGHVHIDIATNWYQ